METMILGSEYNIGLFFPVVPHITTHITILFITGFVLGRGDNRNVIVQLEIYQNFLNG